MIQVRVTPAAKVNSFSPNAPRTPAPLPTRKRSTPHPDIRSIFAAAKFKGRSGR